MLHSGNIKQSFAVGNSHSYLIDAPSEGDPEPSGLYGTHFLSFYPARPSVAHCKIIEIEGHIE